MKVMNKKEGKMAGWLYLIIILCGLFAGAVRSELVDIESSQNTMLNLINNEMLFRMGFLADVLMAVCDAIIAIVFYKLIKHVNPLWAGVATVLRFIQSAVIAVNLLNMYRPLVRLTNFDAIIDPQNTDLALSISQDLALFEYGYLLSGVFFALNCIIFSILILKSEVFSKFWGWAVLVAGFTYITNCVAHFLNLEIASITQVAVVVIAVIVELGFCLYLIFKGAKTV